MRVGVLAYPDCFASEVYGIPDLLLMAHHAAARVHPHTSAPEVHVVGARQGVRAAGGLPMHVERTRQVDVLVVPGFALTATLDLDATLNALQPEIALLRELSRAGTTMVSVCVGAFLLAEAGLLTDRRATTSWLFADRLAARHPDVSVVADRLVLTHRGVTTSAGFSAMYDVALTLIRREYGSRVARSVARLALVDDARSSQAPYVDVAHLATADTEFSAAVKRLLVGQLDAPYVLADLARQLHVSPRTLLRRFKDDTGHSPLHHLQTARVARAKRLLETTDRTLASIAAEVGYQDPGAFSALFARTTGHRPSRYRSAFRSAAVGDAAS